MIRWCAATSLVMAVLVVAGPAPAALSTRPLRSAVTDGEVDAVAVDAGRVFFAGRFAMVGPRTGPGVLLRRDTGKRIAAPEISGRGLKVSAAISDRHGGFYVAGSFGRVGSWRASNVVHLLADGRIDRRFKAATDGSVLALALSGHRLFWAGASCASTAASAAGSAQWTRGPGR
jgi:hypothetical protein